MTILEAPRDGAELDLSVPGPNGRALLASQEANESSARTYPRRLPVAIAEASGSYVTDVDGRVYIDFLAGAGVLALGHNHPALVAAVQDQPRLTCNHGLICDRGSNGLLDLLPEVSRSPEERLSATASAQCPAAWGA
jgi:diaminobutyrate-2-oxoglutarate transaminase